MGVFAMGALPISTEGVLGRVAQKERTTGQRVLIADAPAGRVARLQFAPWHMFASHLPLHNGIRARPSFLPAAAHLHAGIRAWPLTGHAHRSAC